LSTAWRREMKRTIMLETLIIIFAFSPVVYLEAKSDKPKKAEVQAAFDNECDELLIKHIQKAKKTIYAAVYTFTHKDITDAMIKKAHKRVKVKVKLDKKQAEFEYTKTLIKMMKKAGIEVELISMKTRGDHMHHKFAVIDEEIVVTGSFNWTRNAATDNNENIVAIKSKDIAKEFIAAWERLAEQP
jgi:cardiolipin hydrolase